MYLKLTLIYLVQINHFFTRNLKYVIRGNVRLGKCPFGKMSFGEQTVGELSVWKIVRRGNVFGELPVKEVSGYLFINVVHCEAKKLLLKSVFFLNQ